MDWRNPKRRLDVAMKKPKLILFILSTTILFAIELNGQSNTVNSKQPNILLCIADDASFEHVSAYGYGHNKWVETPNFDSIAKEGLLFLNAYTPNAKCAPSRSSILTGRNPWQLEAAANHNPIFPNKFSTVMEALEKNGYAVGYTGKGWAPGDQGEINGKPRSLTGKAYNNLKMVAPSTEMSPIDYSSNFNSFLNEKEKNKPFMFWYGGFEPHRAYEFETGRKKGKKNIDDIKSVPPYWPDTEVVRNDMLDYAYELEYFDYHLGKIIDILKQRGELDNTIIVVTSDNGMPFPRVKGHAYETAHHLPLAVMWKDKIVNPGREIKDFISFIDFAPTFLEAAEVSTQDSEMQKIEGESFLNILMSKEGNSIVDSRDHIIIGRERQDVGRPNDEGYPVRGIVTEDYIYTINYKPNRWPSGNPETGYMDTDGSPTKTEILKMYRAGKDSTYWQLAFGKRGSEELYSLADDEYGINNLADDRECKKIKEELRKDLINELTLQKDPRVLGKGDVFDNYPYSNKNVRNFYERYMNREKIITNWINNSDYEKVNQIKIKEKKSKQ